MVWADGVAGNEQLTCDDRNRVFIISLDTREFCTQGLAINYIQTSFSNLILKLIVVQTSCDIILGDNLVHLLQHEPLFLHLAA